MKDNTEEKLDIISQVEKGEWMVDISVMLNSLLVVYVQFVIVLIEVKKVLIRELKCLCGKTTTVLLE